MARLRFGSVGVVASVVAACILSVVALGLIWGGVLRLRPVPPTDEYIPGEERTIWPIPNEVVRGVAITSDGKLIAASGGAFPGFVRVWDPASGQVVATPVWTASGAEAVAFSPDGKLLAACGANRVVVWEVGSWQQVANLEAAVSADGFVSAIAFSPDGKSLAAGGRLGGPGGLRMWDVGRWDLRLQGVGFPHHIGTIAFSPDGQYLAAGSQVSDLENPGNESGEFLIWDLTDERMTHRTRAHGLFVMALGFSPDGRLATTGCDSTGRSSLRIWEAPQGREIRVIRYEGAGASDVSMSSLQFTPNGARIVTGGSDGCVRIIDVKTGQLLSTLKGGRRGISNEAIFKLTLGPEGRTALTAHYQSVKLWELP